MRGKTLDENPLLKKNEQGWYTLEDPRRCGPLLHRASPALNTALNSKPEVRGEILTKLCTLHILPMPVRQSPLLIAFSFNKDDCWRKPVISSTRLLKILSELVTIIYLTDGHTNPKSRAYAAYHDFIKQLRQKEETFGKEYRKLGQSNTRFIHLLHCWTLDVIRLHEAVIFNAWVSGNNSEWSKLQYYLSPPGEDAIVPLTACDEETQRNIKEDWNTYFNTMNYVFDYDPGFDLNQPYMSKETFIEYYNLFQ